MNSLSLDLPIHGADIDSDALIAARFHARFLDLNAKNRALAHLAGARQTRARGRGSTLTKSDNMLRATISERLIGG